MSSFTKEELIAEINYNLEDCYCSEKTRRLMEIALASLEAEPVQVPDVAPYLHGLWPHAADALIRYSDACRAAILQEAK